MSLKPPSLFPPRYNNYDRAPIDTAPPEEVRRWYAAHRLLTARLRDPGNELWVKLTPGRVRVHIPSAHITAACHLYIERV